LLIRFIIFAMPLMFSMLFTPLIYADAFSLRCRCFTLVDIILLMLLPL